MMPMNHEMPEMMPQTMGMYGQYDTNYQPYPPAPCGCGQPSYHQPSIIKVAMWLWARAYANASSSSRSAYELLQCV